MFRRIKLKIKSLLHRIRVKIFLLGCSGNKKNVQIDFPVKFRDKKNIIIGNYVSVNAFVHIWGTGGVTIGNRVMIATQVSITTLTHDYSSINMRFAPIIKKPVFIEDDVWIGSNATILPGIKICEGAVIGAGSVVTKDVPRFAIVAGIPARVLKYREIKSNAKTTI